MPMRVVVADDDVDVRQGLCAVLDQDPRFTVVGEAADSHSAIDLVSAHRPHAVLVDLRMPGGGITAATAIRAADPHIVVVAVSAQVDATMVADLLRVGVRGIFLKGRLGRDLADMLERCCAGQVLLTTPSAWDGLQFALKGHSG